MKKHQIISLIISLIGLVISSFVLYRKKASKLAYGAALAGSVLLFFAINYVLMSTAPEKKEIDKDAAAQIPATSGSGTATQAPSTGTQSTVPIDRDNVQQSIYHPSKTADGKNVTGLDSDLVTPVMRLSRNA